MKTQPMVQGTLKGGKAIPHQGWGLGLGAVLAAVLFAVVYVGSQGGPATASNSGSARVEPGSQSVADYLGVHASVPDHAGLSPAEQSVADYLRAHSAGTSPQAQSVPDAATQGVLNYIRVHKAIPDSVILELYRAHANPVD
jgi:hypothetical protein